MRKYACLLAALLACAMLFSGCVKEEGTPVASADETATAITTTTVEETSAAEPEEQPDGLREILYRHDNGIEVTQLHISLPASMSIIESIIMDMEFEGFGDSNSPPKPPRKVGEIGTIHELAPGETLEEHANPVCEEDEYEENSIFERLDSGEFTGRRGNLIYYEVKTGGELGAYMYCFYIMLDDTREVMIYLWSNVYTPEADLPRFKEIAATVRP